MRASSVLVLSAPYGWCGRIKVAAWNGVSAYKACGYCNFEGENHQGTSAAGNASNTRYHKAYLRPTVQNLRYVGGRMAGCACWWLTGCLGDWMAKLPGGWLGDWKAGLLGC